MDTKGLIKDNRCDHDRAEFIEQANYEEWWRCLDCAETFQRYIECC